MRTRHSRLQIDIAEQAARPNFATAHQHLLPIRGIESRHDVKIEPFFRSLLELIAHALRLQLSYLSKDQALTVADTILRTLKAARLSIRRR